MIQSILSANVLSLALLPLLLLVLLHVLPILQLRPPVPQTTSAGIIANTVIRLKIAELVCLGSGKLADRQEVHALPAGDSNLDFLSSFAI